MAAQTWDLAYYTTIVSAAGVGNTDSAAVGSVGTPTFWPITYWDGVNLSTGVGNTTSTGVGAGTAVNSTWYDLTGTVSEPATGSGNTTSSGTDSGVAAAGSSTATGSGNTTSTGAGGVTVWTGDSATYIATPTSLSSAQFTGSALVSEQFGSSSLRFADRHAVSTTT